MKTIKQIKKELEEVVGEFGRNEDSEGVVLPLEAQLQTLEDVLKLIDETKRKMKDVEIEYTSPFALLEELKQEITGEKDENNKKIN